MSALNEPKKGRSRKGLGLQFFLPPLLGRFLTLSSLSLANQPATLLPLHAASDTDGLVEDEAPDDVSPRGVVREVSVELARDGVELVEARPGHGGEVVVLVVQADVVC